MVDELRRTLNEARHELDPKRQAALWDAVEEMCAHKSHQLEAKRYYRPSINEAETNIEERIYDV